MDDKNDRNDRNDNHRQSFNQPSSQRKVIETDNDGFAVVRSGKGCPAGPVGLDIVQQSSSSTSINTPA